MKQRLQYLLIILSVVCGLLSCNKGPSLPSLRETFSKKDTDPFGTAVAFEQVEQLFYSNDVRVKKSNLAATLSENADTSSLYISISKKFFLSDADRDQLLSFANRGNAVFISAEEIDSALLGTIGLPPQKIFLRTGDINSLNNTSVRLNPGNFSGPTSFSYFYLPLNNSLTLQTGDSLTRLLGTTESGAPNFILVFYGKGRIYIHSEPRAFSNYFLLQNNNFQYLQQAFNYMDAVPEHLFWDDYYNKHIFREAGSDAQSGLSIILKEPAMAWAFWISLAMMSLYILFGSKRRQRIVPPIQFNQNTSVAFTETISRLYLEKKDNRNIAEKMITYFFEHVRNTYFLNTNQLNDDFISTLSRKSNIPLADTASLIKIVKGIQRSYQQVSDQQLLSLNTYIEKFHQHKS